MSALIPAGSGPIACTFNGHITHHLSATRKTEDVSVAAFNANARAAPKPPPCDCTTRTSPCAAKAAIRSSNARPGPDHPKTKPFQTPCAPIRRRAIQSDVIARFPGIRRQPLNPRHVQSACIRQTPNGVLPSGPIAQQAPPPPAARPAPHIAPVPPLYPAALPSFARSPNCHPVAINSGARPATRSDGFNTGCAKARMAAAIASIRSRHQPPRACDPAWFPYPPAPTTASPPGSRLRRGAGGTARKSHHKTGRAINPSNSQGARNPIEPETPSSRRPRDCIVDPHQRRLRRLIRVVAQIHPARAPCQLFQLILALGQPLQIIIPQRLGPPGFESSHHRPCSQKSCAHRKGKLSSVGSSTCTRQPCTR